jgi:hypothetical protein
MVLKGNGMKQKLETVGTATVHFVPWTSSRGRMAGTSDHEDKS